jgi:hypothetical protein
MTAWHLASIPFWILALFSALSAIAVYPYRKPTETQEELGAQLIGALLVSGITSGIAAWMWQ